jgi:hypothetical protein
MTDIARFFTQDIVVRRLSTVSGYRKEYQATATVEGHIQAMDKEARANLGILEEKAWIAWFPVDTNLTEHDVITDTAHNKEFEIREIVKKDYGVNQHLEVILMEKNA